MNVIESLHFPVLVFPPNGIMPYSHYDNLLRVMKHEYDKQWYNDLEVVDCDGSCAVIHSASIIGGPILGWIFGGMVEIEITDAEKLTNYDVEAVRDRVMKFLDI